MRIPGSMEEHTKAKAETNQNEEALQDRHDLAGLMLLISSIL
jgi:hypothetical protein